MLTVFNSNFPTRSIIYFFFCMQLIVQIQTLSCQRSRFTGFSYYRLSSIVHDIVHNQVLVIVLGDFGGCIEGVEEFLRSCVSPKPHSPKHRLPHLPSQRYLLFQWLHTMAANSRVSLVGYLFPSKMFFENRYIWGFSFQL